MIVRLESPKEKEKQKLEDGGEKLEKREGLDAVDVLDAELLWSN